MRLPKSVIFTLAALALALVLALPAASPAWAGQADAHIHFLVAPTNPRDKTLYEALEALRLGLANLAGGYTELGATDGGAMHEGVLVREVNYSFLISGSQDLSAEIAELVNLYFTDNPFILHWTGQVFIQE